MIESSTKFDIGTGAIPNHLGYRWPAEWEPHVATWLSWPRREGISFPDAYDKVLPAIIKMVTLLTASERVNINVADSIKQAEIESYFPKEVLKQITFFYIPVNEPWCRDHGPVFVTREISPQSLILDWGYNAWGGKYPPFDFDDLVPTKIAKELGLPVLAPKMVLEGGSIDGNGDGTVLTTTSCLLNPNRNPTLKKKEIEKNLCDYLGVKQILWLGDGIEGDDTDGHIDDITRFVNRNTVVTMVEKNKNCPNHKPLLENYEKLKTMRLWDGTPLNIIPIQMPRRIERDGMRLPASYANFYIANNTVLLPVFQDPDNDEMALKILQQAFPTRKVVAIDSTELIWGLGAFHCLTQQQPVV